jgi:hypothetical protein
VRLVIIAGQVVMEDRQLCHVDERQVLREAQTRARALLTRAGHL